MTTAGAVPQTQRILILLSGVVRSTAVLHQKGKVGIQIFTVDLQENKNLVSVEHADSQIGNPD